MKEIQKEMFKRMLYKKRGEMLRDSKRGIKNCLSGEARQTFGTGFEIGDLSAFHQSESMRYWQFDSQKEVVKKIDMAITRLEEGKYGICEGCNNEISEERLRAVPFAIYCKDCQESRELQYR